jgi:hypothetical protein
LLVLVRDSWAVFRLEVDTRVHRDTLATKLLDVVHVLCKHLLDIVVKMNLNLLVTLLNLHTKKQLHENTPVGPRDLEILGVLAHEFQLEFGRG